MGADVIANIMACVQSVWSVHRCCFSCV